MFKHEESQVIINKQKSQQQFRSMVEDNQASKQADSLIKKTKPHNMIEKFKKKNQQEQTPLSTVD